LDEEDPIEEMDPDIVSAGQGTKDEI